MIRLCVGLLNPTIIVVLCLNFLLICRKKSDSNHIWKILDRFHQLLETNSRKNWNFPLSLSMLTMHTMCVCFLVLIAFTTVSTYYDSVEICKLFSIITKLVEYNKLCNVWTTNYLYLYLPYKLKGIELW